MRHAIIALLLLFAAGCALQTDTPADQTPVTDPIDGPADAWYAGGALHYRATVDKPTPCHAIRADERILESYPVQIVVDLDVVAPEPDIICAQVIATEEFAGSVPIDHVPGRVSISLEGETLFESSDIEER